MSPIKNPEHYPARSEWKETRERILKRATPDDGFDTPRCECSGECGRDHGDRCYARNGWNIYKSFNPARTSKVVLTLAHLDHDASVGNHADDNLKAMCQNCHLAYDRPHNVAKARRTREEKSGELRLFEVSP